MDSHTHLPDTHHSLTHNIHTFTCNLSLTLSQTNRTQTLYSSIVALRGCWHDLAMQQGLFDQRRGPTGHCTTHCLRNAPTYAGIKPTLFPPYAPWHRNKLTPTQPGQGTPAVEAPTNKQTNRKRQKANRVKPECSDLNHILGARPILNSVLLLFFLFILFGWNHCFGNLNHTTWLICFMTGWQRIRLVLILCGGSWPSLTFFTGLWPRSKIQLCSAQWVFYDSDWKSTLLHCLWTFFSFSTTHHFQ